MPKETSILHKYLPRYILDLDNLSSFTFSCSLHLYNCIKFLQYLFIRLGEVALRIKYGQTDRQTG